jgi:mannosyltransferase
MALPLSEPSISPPLAYEAPLPQRPGSFAAVARPSRPVAVLLMLVLTGAAAFLRLWNSTGQSLRLDEGFSIRWAAAPLQPVMQGHTEAVRSLFQVTASDVHPPGYFLLLHFWMQAFGANLAVLRLPSEIAGTLAIPVVYLLGASLYSRSVGLFAAVFAAFSPFLIWHSQEARMYAFLVLFTLLSTYGLVLALRQGLSRGWVLFGIASFLAIYTQYYAFLVLFAQSLFVVFHWRQYPRRQILTWFGVMVLLAISYIPWVLTFHANYHGASDPGLQTPTLYTPFTLLSTFLFGYLSVPTTSDVIAAWPLLVVAGLIFGVFAGRITRQASFLWLLFLVPIVMAFLITFTVRPFLSDRYLIVSLPALYILLAVALDRIQGRGLRIAMAVLVVLVSLVSWAVAERSPLNPEVQDYRSAVQYIQVHAQPGDVVALDSFYNQDAFSYYSHLNLPTYDFPLPPNAVTGAVPPASRATFQSYLRGIAAGRMRLWVLYYLETNYDPDNIVRTYLAYHTAGHSVIYGGRYGRNDSSYPNSFRNVQLVRYDLIPRPVAATQTRPETTQELRSVSAISPTLRYPFASPTGPFGARSSLVGTVLAPTRPLRSWYFPALTNNADAATLTLFNPNPRPVSVTVTGSFTGTQTVNVPAASNVDLQLGGTVAGPPAQSLQIQASGLISTMRTVSTGTSAYVENGIPARNSSSR